MRLNNFELFRLRHWEQPMLKSVIREVWEKEPLILTESCSRFRKDVSINQYLIRYWQFASNRFYPIHWDTGKYISLSVASVEGACRILNEGKVKSVCLNDNPLCTDEDALIVERTLQQAFENKFPNKSVFEK